MEAAKKKDEEENLFERLGLEVAQGQVEVGQTYPIFGMITRIDKQENEQIIVQINYNITARLNVKGTEKLNLLKSRAFETGIFIATVLQKDPAIEVECKTVIFGKSQAYNA